MTVNLATLVGPNCITLGQGQQVYDLVRPRLASGVSVVMNCAGVNVFASPFFNAAVGQLLRDFQPAELRTLLHVEGLSEPGQALLRLVVENSRQYYSDVDSRQIVDAMLLEHSDE